MGGFLLGLEGVILLLVAVAAAVGAAWGTPEVWISGGRALNPVLVRAVLGILAAAFLAGAAVIAALALRRRAARRALRRSGPKGEIFICPDTVRQLAAGLLAGELGLTGFRVALRPVGEGVALRVVLKLPAEEEIPPLAERLQNLLAQEVAAKTGLEVHEVRLVVRGASRKNL
ncbi:MAG: alkaline shock response membrane anchor protein AmaP [Candidatus Acetothermia bacterium]|nr:alkaline shock response membrane anchor protein AmaP [Candidatus Acetothermia bacterium]